MFEMAFAVDRIGQPQPQAWIGEQGIDDLNARRMAVEQLVLEQALPADEPGAERQNGPPGKRLIIPCGQAEPDVDGERHGPGRRFKTPP